VLKQISVRANLAGENRRGGERGEAGHLSLDVRIARRLALLRAQRGWSLDALAARTGISRASLSRLERGELSPTASMLGALCTQYGWTLSRLMAEAESGPPSVVRGPGQVTWKNPASGYLRRIISPPHPNLRGELVEVSLPAGVGLLRCFSGDRPGASPLDARRESGYRNRRNLLSGRERRLRNVVCSAALPASNAGASGGPGTW
jgi:transcriptional regulator with XRE-family HTH domain